jgi:hypothetical protein
MPHRINRSSIVSKTGAAGRIPNIRFSFVWHSVLFGLREYRYTPPVQRSKGKFRGIQGCRSLADAANYFRVDGARSKCTLHAMDHTDQRDLPHAWRRAVESWPRRQGLIEISINQQPVPPFSPNMAS